MHQAQQLITFRQSTPKSIISAEVFSKLNNRECDLGEQWKKSNMEEACLYIKQWKCFELWIYDGQEPKIIRDIYNIQFTELTWLSLSNNNLETADGLERVWMPNLEGLYLTQNLLINILPLRKMNCPKLKKLGLFQNYIQNGNELTEMKFNEKTQFIQIQLNREHRPNFLNVSVFLKIQAQEIEDLQFYSYQRIRQPNVRKELLKKYQQIMLYDK